MLYNWSKILNTYPWARVAVMNDDSDDVMVFEYPEVSSGNGCWRYVGGKTQNKMWMRAGGEELLSSKRPGNYEETKEIIPDIFLANFEEE